MTMRARLLFYAIFCCMTAASSYAGGAAPGDGKTHREGSYFEVALPAGWTPVPAAGYGLSPAEKKVYGLELAGPAEGALISAHYYAPGNLVDKTPEKYIRVHSLPEGAKPAALPALPKAAGDKVGGRKAKLFVNITHARGAERTVGGGAEVWEAFAVIPLKSGYYALRYSAPAAKYAESLPAFEAFLASFRPLLK